MWETALPLLFLFILIVIIIISFFKKSWCCELFKSQNNSKTEGRLNLDNVCVNEELGLAISFSMWFLYNDLFFYVAIN